MRLPIRSLAALTLLALPTVASADLGIAVGPLADRAPLPNTALQSFDQNVATGARFVPGELLVVAQGASLRGEITAAGAALGCRLERQMGRRPFFLFACSPSADMRQLFAAWQQVPNVRWLEASFIEEMEALPNDLEESQWYHQNDGQTLDGVRGIEGADIGSVNAWDVTTGDRARVILIADVGIDPDHPDLAEQIWRNEDEDCTNGIDDDDNGYVDDCMGYDFGDDDNDPNPNSLPLVQTDEDDCLKWHATMIAGLAGARGNNGQGVVGVNWNVSFMNVKKHRDSSCASTTSRSVEAVAYAIDNGADVVSMSFSSSTYNATFEQVLKEGEMRGLIAVSSGGNGGRNDDNLTRYPNEYAITNKIVVVNSNNQDTLSEGSNYGPTSVDLAAPGTFVLSTLPGAMYSYGSGSSYSAGFVAGAATLVWSAFPSLSSAEVVQSIMEGAKRLPTLDCAQTARCIRSGARMDLFGSLSRASELAPASLSMVGYEVLDLGNGDGVIERGEAAELRPTLANAGRGAAFGVEGILSVVSGPPSLYVEQRALTLGDVLAGSSSDPSAAPSPLRIALGLECPEDTVATLQLELTDRFGRAQVTMFDVPLSCPAAIIDMPPVVEDEAAGCACSHSEGAGTASLGLLVLGIAFLRRRR